VLGGVVAGGVILYLIRSLLFFKSTVSVYPTFSIPSIDSSLGNDYISDETLLESREDLWWEGEKVPMLFCPSFAATRSDSYLPVGDLKGRLLLGEFARQKGYRAIVDLPDTMRQHWEQSPYDAISLYANDAIRGLPLDLLMNEEDFWRRAEKVFEDQLFSSCLKAKYGLVINDMDTLKQQLEIYWQEGYFNHTLIYLLARRVLLEYFKENKIYQQIKTGKLSDFDSYRQKEQSWLIDYSQFHSILMHRNGEWWIHWDEAVKNHGQGAVEAYLKTNGLEEEVLFFAILPTADRKNGQKSAFQLRERESYIL